MKRPACLSNQLLLALPSIDDDHFSRIITLICDQNNHGSFGIIINHPTHLPLSKNFDRVKLKNNKLSASSVDHIGGGMQPQASLVLDENMGSWTSTLPITNSLRLTTYTDMLNALAKASGSKLYLFILGYADWIAGRLKQEIQNNPWLVAPNCRKILFETPADKRWLKATANRGVDVSNISCEIGHV